MEIDGRIWVIDQVKGEKELLDEKKIRVISGKERKGIPEFGADIFVNLALTNESDIWLTHFKSFRTGFFEKKKTGTTTEWNTRMQWEAPWEEISIWAYLKGVDLEKWIVRGWLALSVLSFCRKHAIPKLIEWGLADADVRRRIMNMLMEQFGFPGNEFTGRAHGRATAVTAPPMNEAEAEL